MYVIIGLETLKDIDGGRIREALDHHIRRAALDCKDRPGDPAARVVTMTIKIVPEIEDDGSCDRCRMAIEFTSKVPNHRSKAIEVGLRANGALVFNPDSPDNINQSTFMDGDQ